MATKIRKIGFYYLTLISGDTTIETALKQILNYIENLSKVDRNRTICSYKKGKATVVLEKIRIFDFLG